MQDSLSDSDANATRKSGKAQSSSPNQPPQASLAAALRQPIRRGQPALALACQQRRNELLRGSPPELPAVAAAAGPGVGGIGVTPASLEGIASAGAATGAVGG
jgi:hypothetical protein